MKTSLSLKSLLVAAVAASAIGAASLGIAADDSQPTAPPPARRDHADAQNITGTVNSFNYGPRGNVESLNLTIDGKLAQINLPPELANALSQSVNTGDSIKATVCPDNGPPHRPNGGPRGPRGSGGPGGPRGVGGPQANGPQGPDQDQGPGGAPNRGPAPDAQRADHPVYRVVSLTDAKGKEYRANTPPTPGDRKAVHVEGTVKSLNYDHRGFINGLQLDNGDLVRLDPREASLFDFAPGKKVTIDGIAEPLSTGGRTIDANTLNGILVKTEMRPGPRGRRPSGPGGPAARAPRGRGGSDGGPGADMSGSMGGPGRDLAGGGQEPGWDQARD